MHEAQAALSTRHRYHELIYIERGEGDYYVESQLVRVRPGDSWLLAPECFHLHPDPMRYTYWLLRFDGDVAATSSARVFDVLPKTQAHRIRIAEPQRMRWESRFRYLHDELRLPGTDDDGIVLHLVRSILRDACAGSRGCEEQNGFARNRVIEAIFRYIDAHYHDAPRLRDIAAAVNFSPAYLTDLVRRETGRPIHQWLNLRRIRAATALLTETDLPIGAIAEQVGFHDPTYFGRYFSRITGKTPRDWRGAYRSEGFQQQTSLFPLQQGVLAPQRYHLTVRRFAEDCAAAITWRDVEAHIASAIEKLYRPPLVQILRKNGATFKISRQLGGLPSSSHFPTISESEGVLPLVIKGEAIAAHDFERSPIELFRRFRRLGYRSLIVAPIALQGKCLGAIRVLDRGRIFSEHDRSILATIGAIAGLALADKLTDIHPNERSSK